MGHPLGVCDNRGCLTLLRGSGKGKGMPRRGVAQEGCAVRWRDFAKIPANLGLRVIFRAVKKILAATHPKPAPGATRSGQGRAAVACGAMGQAGLSGVSQNRLLRHTADPDRGPNTKDGLRASCGDCGSAQSAEWCAWPEYRLSRYPSRPGSSGSLENSAILLPCGSRR